jgi:uncharacterized RDD family membrane protein YckC
MNQKTNTISIRTPEGIHFSLALASPVIRFLAWLIDALCITALANVAGALIGLMGIINWDIASAFSILAYFIISIGYAIVLEYYWRGQTLGKRVLKVRVMDEQAFNVKFSQIVIRNLLRFVDNLPLAYLVGGLTALISQKFQRLGDLAANTIVVRNPKIRKPDMDQILPDKYNSLKDYPHLNARLRQRVSPDEAGIALQSLLRRKHLDPQARVELYEEIASHFKNIVSFPAEATDGISDEQYIRNVVEVLFRSSSNK